MDDIIIPEVESVDTVPIINPDTRIINVDSDFLLGVETDNDAERVKFQCSKIVGDNLDLSQYHIYIHYQNAKGEKGKYLCEDVEDDGENITFSWLLKGKAVLYKGQTKFLVCAKKTDAETIVWNTTLASGNVLEGLDVDEDIVQQNDDVIEQILLRLEKIEESGGTGDINNAKVTFTEAEERANIESQETISTIFGKLKKWYTDLKTVAFSGSYNDLSNKPSIPTKTSELTNDSNFLTAIPDEYVTNTELDEKGFAKTSDIPSKLPNPQKLTFTGAVNAEYDGSEEKTINIPEGGSGGGYDISSQTAPELIVEKTLTAEEAEIVNFTFTSETYPLIEKCNEFFISVMNSTDKSIPYWRIAINNIIGSSNGNGNQGYSYARVSLKGSIVSMRISNWESISLVGSSTNSTGSGHVSAYELLKDLKIESDKITKISISSYIKWLDEGSIIRIYGWKV